MLTWFIFFVFFPCFFCVYFLGGPGESFGCPWVDLGAIRGAFLCHFGFFFRIGWIFENMCFITVKQYFFRSGRVQIRDFFVLRFLIYSNIFNVFLSKFCGFVEFQGPQRIPNGSLLETLRGQT